MSDRNDTQIKYSLEHHAGELRTVGERHKEKNQLSSLEKKCCRQATRRSLKTRLYTSLGKVASFSRKRTSKTRLVHTFHFKRRQRSRSHDETSHVVSSLGMIHKLPVSSRQQEPTTENVCLLSSSSESNDTESLETSDKHDDGASASTDGMISEDSLLDSCSDDESSIESDCVGIDRVLKRFERREKILTSIIVGKAPLYKETILANESASRAKTLRSLGFNRETCPVVDQKMIRPLFQSRSLLEHRKSISLGSNYGALERSSLFFEGRHFLEAAWAVSWYCIGHYGVFSIFEVIIYLALQRSGLSPSHFHALLILFALFIMRVNGYLWEWLCLESRRRVKFDMHNRRVLGYWDARVLATLRKPLLRGVNPIISMSAFYMLFHGCSYFYYDVFMTNMETAFVQWQQQEETRISEIMEVPTNMPTYNFLPFLEDPSLPNNIMQCFDGPTIQSPELMMISSSIYVLVVVLAAGAMASVGNTVFEL